MSSSSASSPPMEERKKIFEVRREYFDAIKNRTKTIEGRKNTPTWSNICVHDTVRVRCENEEVLVKVTDIKDYPSLYDYLLREDISVIMPRRNLVDIHNTYLTFWTEEEISIYGIRAFHIKLL
jgi:ASC-1-like (ASCH) protein